MGRHTARGDSVREDNELLVQDGSRIQDEVHAHGVGQVDDGLSTGTGNRVADRTTEDVGEYGKGWSNRQMKQLLIDT